MAVYVICPHCLHPAVVRRGRLSKGRMCRQCGELYYIGESESLEAEAIPARKGYEQQGILRRISAADRLPVYELI